MRMILMAASAAIVFAVGFAQPAEAKKRKHYQKQYSYYQTSKQAVGSYIDVAAIPPYPTTQSGKYRGRRSSRSVRIERGQEYVRPSLPADNLITRETYERSNRGTVRYHASQVIGGRPAGCPTRFCGCGLSLEIFGKIRPELNLAWNWVKYFPRTSPAPGMAAARRGHVMGLLSHVSGYDWLVYDANSGGGLTRRHVRSIRGYVVVNPHVNRMAGL